MYWYSNGLVVSLLEAMCIVLRSRRFKGHDDSARASHRFWPETTAHNLVAAELKARATNWWYVVPFMSRQVKRSAC